MRCSIELAYGAQNSVVYRIARYNPSASGADLW